MWPRTIASNKSIWQCVIDATIAASAASKTHTAVGTKTQASAVRMSWDYCKYGTSRTTQSYSFSRMHIRFFTIVTLFVVFRTWPMTLMTYATQVCSKKRSSSLTARAFIWAASSKYPKYLRISKSHGIIIPRRKDGMLILGTLVPIFTKYQFRRLLLCLKWKIKVFVCFVNRTGMK